MKFFRTLILVNSLAAFSIAILGCMGGNFLIAVAHGAALVALSGYWVLRYTGTDSGEFQIKKECILPLRPSLMALAALTVFCILSILFNWESYERPFKDLKKLRYQAIIILFLLVPYFRNFLCRSPNWQKVGFWLAWGAAGIVTGSGLIGMATGFHPLLLEPISDTTELTGISSSKMTYAYSLQLFVLLAAALVVDALVGPGWTKRIIRHRWTRLIFLIVTLIFLTGALYLTSRRGPAVGVAVGGVCLLVMARSIRLWCVCGCVGALILVAGYRSESRHLKNFSPDYGLVLTTNDYVRINQWRTAWLAFREHPWFGLGHRQFEKQCIDLKEKYGVAPDYYHGYYFNSHAHSNYLEAFASNGFFGGVAFIAFCIFWIYELVRSSHAKLYFLPIALAFFVSGFVENTFTDSEVLHCIMVLYFISQVALDAELNCNTSP